MERTRDEDHQEEDLGQHLFRPRACIVSDIRLYRESLESALATRCSIDVVNTIAADTHAFDQIALTYPDVILLDFAAANGSWLIRAVTKSLPTIRIIVFALPESGLRPLAIAGSGIAASVGWDASPDELVAAIHTVLRSELTRAARTTSPLLRSAGLSVKCPTNIGGERLTNREREIVGLIDRGLSNKDIARSLRLSDATVKNHVHNILEKLNVHRRGEAAARLRV
jgi:DNA-binding NarL/FixJ family response regulator